jgi:hypothetical protein
MNMGRQKDELKGLPGPGGEKKETSDGQSRLASFSGTQLHPSLL